MNEPGDLTITHNSATPDPKNCSLVSIIPIVGMSSCRGRAEAFARHLSSKLRTLGSQADDAEISQGDEKIINGGNTNTWVTTGDGTDQTVTDLQPLRHEPDSFFDFDCELESPGSPVDECEYLRLIESSSNTPHNSAAESGYAHTSVASSHSSSEVPYFDVNINNEACMIHLKTHQPAKAIQQKSSHICQPHNQTAESADEVDSAAVLTTRTGQCNGYEHHKDLTQHTLPSEGPDIGKNELEHPKQYEINHNIQHEILKELQRQSLDYAEDNKDSDKNVELEDVKLEMVTETETEVRNTNTEQQLEADQSVHIRNGCTENGHDMLKDEAVEEVCSNEVKAQETEQLKETITETATETETITETATETETKTETETETLNDTKTSGDNSAVSENNENEKSVITTTENDTPKKAHLHMDTTDDEDDRPQRIRRCSSLKTGKTPPGTPGRKKIVRFADVLGLDLADVKTFLDEIPTIPKSAYQDLEIMDNEPPIQLGPKSDKLLMPLFQQPGGLSNFLDIVREKLVSLENAAVTDAINQTITGSVRVRNLDFHKSVHIRYSLDGWRSFADLQANYAENSCDGFSDKFSFVLFGNSLHIGQRLEFAVRFQCKGQQYWDNNYGANYCFQCLPTSAPVINPISNVLPSHHSDHMAALLSPTVGETWCTSFY